jgi:predicted HicB family RNase H-like nuclease
MAIAKNPKRSHTPASEEQAQAFISGAGQPVASPDREQNKKPIMIRVDPEMLDRIDRAAKRLGISRSAFIVSSAAVRLESME